MTNREKRSEQLLQGTHDLIALHNLADMDPHHAYEIASRLQHLSGDAVELNQGTLYPALVRLGQSGWIKGSWGRTERNREAKFYELPRAGRAALEQETTQWRRMSSLVEKLLVEGTQG